MRETPRVALSVCIALCLLAAASACASERRSSDGASARDDAALGSPTDVISQTAGVSGDAAVSVADVVSDTVEAGNLGDVVARVNGEPVSLEEFRRQAIDTQRFYVEQGLDPNTDAGQQQLLYLRKQVLDDMINQVLVEQAAKELGVAVADDEVAAAMAKYVEEFGSESALDASLATTGTSRDEIREMERASIVGQKMLDRITADVPMTAEFVHARHVLCDTRADCDAALARIEAGETFEAVAASASKDETSAQRGGDLDWVARGMLPSQQLEDAIFAVQPGQRSGVVATDYGFHVIETIERDPQRELSAEQRYTLREKRLMEWLAQRRKASTIEIYVADLRELEAADS